MLKVLTYSMLKISPYCFSFFCFWAIPVIAQEVSWNKDRYLLTEDFKAKADSKSPFFAMTYTKISHSIQLEDNKLIVRLFHVFDSQKSWIKKEKADSALLAHEQLHFDISELHARRIQIKLRQLKIAQDAIKVINNLISLELNKLYREQDRYDHETLHGIQQEQQSKWTQTIREEFSKYPDTLGYVEFDYPYPINDR